ncbi:hypothetical protein DL771_006980 [Monosporascus sp. 5C6A]|nr:hypothetical protein DL771_006980 [Monosporascus sp. 5C6A]
MKNSPPTEEPRRGRSDPRVSAPKATSKNTGCMQDEVHKQPQDEETLALSASAKASVAPSGNSMNLVKALTMGVCLLVLSYCTLARLRAALGGTLASHAPLIRTGWSNTPTAAASSAHHRPWLVESRIIGLALLENAPHEAEDGIPTPALPRRRGVANVVDRGNLGEKEPARRRGETRGLGVLFVDYIA